MAEHDFSITQEQLQSLLDPKSPENLNALGGVEAVAAALHCDIHKGLLAAQVEVNRLHYGNNDLPELAVKSFFDLVCEGLQDRTLLMLMVAAAVSLILGVRENPSTGWIEGAAILLAVVIVVFVSSVNDYEKERQFRSLNAKKEMKDIKVLRDGEEQQVVVTELVVGDIVLVDTGDKIAVDGVYLSGHGLKCDESCVTGETDLIKKGCGGRLDPFFLSGSQVMDGIGKMVVVAVGVNSYHGKQMMALRVEPQETPLQVKLGELANEIGYYGLLAATANVGCLIGRELWHVWWVGDRSFDNQFVSAVVQYIITGITILVVAIPEGLPLAVTMALAYSMVKMLEDNNLVRRLEACETMGGATYICSDKTGTLTQNKMCVVRGCIADVKFDKVTPDLGKQLPEGVVQLTNTGLSVNTTAYHVGEGHGYVGSKTEGALLDMVEILGGDYKAERKETDIVHMYPFSSELKQMSTVTVLNQTTLRLHVKGAPESLLGQCETYIDSQGQKQPMNSQKRAMILNEVQTMSRDTLRTLCFAYADIPKETRDYEHMPQLKLTHIGLVGIEDPLREEVPEAVRLCQEAGIKVRMVTGDNIETAKSIAKRCGIYDEQKGGLAMEGPEFRAIDDQQRLEQVVFRLQVLARSSPLDKQILVKALKDMGEVVAVTGDGTNDGPALKLADVGFSMGLSGTDVAKEASDIVLMDDNFSSIVSAVMWGRNVFDSIRKFIQFQLTVNIVAVTLAFVGSLSNASGESPLRPVQLLWVNLIMDSMAALALATERPTRRLLHRLPYSKRTRLITPMMWHNITWQALLQLVVLGTLLHSPERLGLEAYSKKHLTIFFNTFVMLQVFNEFNARKIDGELNVFKGLTQCPIFLAVIAFTVVVQFLLVQYGGDFVGCTPLDRNEWLFCLGLAALSLPMGLLIRIMPPLSLGNGGGPDTRSLWAEAINKTRQQVGVVEAFRRKHSVETHFRPKQSS